MTTPGTGESGGGKTLGKLKHKENRQKTKRVTRRLKQNTDPDSKDLKS